jgi:16S rRNA (guanine966-N2)-methyltransferase
MPVERFLSQSTETFDVTFVDPPYALALASVGDVMTKLEPRLSDGGIVVLRRRAGDPGSPAAWGLRLEDRRRYGDDEIFRYVKGLP